MAHKMPQAQVKIPKTVADAVDAEAEERGMSRNRMVEMACTRFLDWCAANPVNGNQPKENKTCPHTN